MKPSTAAAGRQRGGKLIRPALYPIPVDTYRSPSGLLLLDSQAKRLARAIARSACASGPERGWPRRCTGQRSTPTAPTRCGCSHRALATVRFLARGDGSPAPTDRRTGLSVVGPVWGSVPLVRGTRRCAAAGAARPGERRGVRRRTAASASTRVRAAAVGSSVGEARASTGARAAGLPRALPRVPRWSRNGSRWVAALQPALAAAPAVRAATGPRRPRPGRRAAVRGRLPLSVARTASPWLPMCRRGRVPPPHHDRRRCLSTWGAPQQGMSPPWHRPPLPS